MKCLVFWVRKFLLNEFEIFTNLLTNQTLLTQKIAKKSSTVAIAKWKVHIKYDINICFSKISEQDLLSELGGIF